MKNNEQISNMQTNVATVGGGEIQVTPELTFKADVSAAVQTAVSMQALQLIQGFQDIAKGYFKVLPTVAGILASECWKQLEGVKSVNSFITELTGCSKATASELVKVAGRFYTSDGEPLKWVEVFTYSELIQLASMDEDGVERVKAIVGDKFKREDVVRAITEVKAQKLLEKNGIDPESISDDNDSNNADSNLNGTDNDSDNVDSTSNDADSGSTVEPQDGTHWLSVEKVTKLKEELQKSSKGKCTKTEMQEISFRALQTIKAYETLAENPFE